MNTFLYAKGDEARDKVTGFSGIITGRADYIAGCRQYSLSPRAKDDGSLPEALWFDEERIEVVIASAVTIEASPTGGPSGRERAPAR